MTAARVLLLVALLWAGASVAQNLYRWTDANGKVHYGNELPAGAKTPNEVRDRINTYSGPPQVQPSSAVAAGQVVMYATSWCGYCAQARAHFARKGIRYVEYDVEKSAAAKAEFKRLGGRGVPLILYGRERMNGFSPGSFDAMHARASR
jgi:glutaredoxin